MSEQKVFQMNDCDWWAGEDLESVQAAYLKEMDITDPLDVASYTEDTHEVADLDMERLKFVEGDDPIPEENWTFRKQLDHMVEMGCEFPCFFASTEW